MRYLIFYKPYGVLSQFTRAHGRSSLADFGFPGGVYAAGRLDADSEGLLFLTDDGVFQSRIAEPKHKTPKVYLAQVEGVITEDPLEKLRKGVLLNDGPTLPCGARAIPAPSLPPREPPIRFRKTVPDSWAEIDHEAAHRQVRRMLRASHVGLVCAIGPLTLTALRPVSGANWRMN